MSVYERQLGKAIAEVLDELGEPVSDDADGPLILAATRLAGVRGFQEGYRMATLDYELALRRRGLLTSVTLTQTCDLPATLDEALS